LLSPSRCLLPCSGRCKQAFLILSLVLAAGCGGGDGDDTPSAVTLQGSGYRYAAPGDWTVKRFGRTLSACAGEDAVSFTIFRLARPYRPALWERVVPELDSVAERLAGRLGATVAGRSTEVVAARRARVYRFEDARDGTQIIGFVLDGRREYQLLCRGDADAACTLLLQTFELT